MPALATPPRSVLTATLGVHSLVALALAVLIVLIVDAGGGTVGYTLDDAYIHLALAENLTRGHYGINPGEVAAPSSSILFPYLVAIGLAVGLGDWTNLVINIVALFAAVAVILDILARPEIDHAVRAPFCRIAALAIILGGNLVTMVFTGMEHVLQVLVALCVVRGFVVGRDGGRLPATFWIAVAVGPLIRFEMASFTVAGLVFGAATGRIRGALVASAFLAAALGAQALLMDRLGLPLLPSSVLAKLSHTQVGAGGDSFAGLIVAALANASRELEFHYAMYAVVLTGFVVFAALRGASDLAGARGLWCAGLVAFGLGGHLAFGQAGIFHRYILYLYVAATLLAILAHARPLAFLLRHRPAAFAVIAVFFLVASMPMLRSLAWVPSAARNIYEQQHQMHRFATEFHRGPVAVNDLGWVAYRNEHQVVDLWGLGSEAARKARMRGEPGWMEAFVDRHGVGVVMVYDDWFAGQIPPAWRRVAVLRLASARVAAAGAGVSFYLTSAGDGAKLARDLDAFAASLPAGVRLERLAPR